MKRTAWLNFAVLIVVNFLWAGQYPAYKIASDSMSVAGLNFWMLVFALPLLIPIHLKFGRKEKLAHLKRDWRGVWEFLLLGLLGIIPPSVLLAWGIEHSSAANAAILSLTIPVLMTMLGVVMLGERITAIRVVSLILGIVGFLLVSTNDLAHVSFDRSLLLGNAAIFIGGLGSAFYNTYSKNLLARYSELEVLIYGYIVSALACAILSAATERRPFYSLAGYSGETWLAVLFLGAISWGLAMVLWLWVLNRLEVGQVSSSIYLLPLFGVLLSVMTLHEQITVRQVFGGAITLAGTAVLMFVENRRPAQHNGATAEEAL